MRHILKKLTTVARGKPQPVDIPPLCYVHLPKCGGQSLVGSLRQVYSGRLHQSTNMGAALKAFAHYYAAAESYSPPWQLEWSRFMQALLSTYLAGSAQLVYGHHPCGSAILQRYSSQWKFITVLREPVSRVVSNYVYDRIGPAKLFFNTEASPEQELEQYLESDQAVWQANLQTAMLGGLIDTPHDFAAEYEAAMANLKQYHAIGITEDMDGFGERMHELLGVPVMIGRTNTAQKWQADGGQHFNYRGLFTDRVLERVKELAVWDVKLYDHVKGQLC